MKVPSKKKGKATKGLKVKRSKPPPAPEPETDVESLPREALSDSDTEKRRRGPQPGKPSDAKKVLTPGSYPIGKQVLIV